MVVSQKQGSNASELAHWMSVSRGVTRKSYHFPPYEVEACQLPLSELHTSLKRSIYLDGESIAPQWHRQELEG